MLRREFLALAAASIFDKPGAAVLIHIATRRVLYIHGAPVAARHLAPPGSTLKPLVLAALLRSGRLSATEPIHCPGRLTVAGRSFDCSHPHLDTPMRADTALAYSCNYFVARVAERFAPNELAAELERRGLASPTALLNQPEASGRVDRVSTRDAIRLQALGESGVAITTAELALAYRSLAQQTPPAVLAGLEGAVQYGTAQHARVDGVQVAGKTGSVIADNGARVAWFAGFMPSRAPEVALAVMLQGHSGGSDAAPIAGRILAAYRAGKL